MRWRLIVLGLLALALAVSFALCTHASVDLSFRGQQVFSGAQQPTQKEQDEATRLFRQSSALQLVGTPLATGSLICALAIPAVLGRRWQLREDAMLPASAR